MALSKALKERWIEALESGEYRKAREFLYNPNSKGYCCLGVLADIQFPDDTWKDEKAIMPKDLDDWGKYGWPGDMDVIDLARLNDSRAGFPIDYIKEHC